MLLVANTDSLIWRISPTSREKIHPPQGIPCAALVPAFPARFCMVVVYQKPHRLWSLSSLKCHFGVSSYLISKQPEHDLFWMMPRQLCKWRLDNSTCISNCREILGRSHPTSSDRFGIDTCELADCFCCGMVKANQRIDEIMISVNRTFTGPLRYEVTKCPNPFWWHIKICRFCRHDQLAYLIARAAICISA